jgi:hypothetical protein
MTEPANTAARSGIAATANHRPAPDFTNWIGGQAPASDR